MRLIYTDEAGTAANEPITVVVALIVNADLQFWPVVKRIITVLETVPAKFRKDFVFHATDVWNDHKYRPDWSMEDRVTFLKRIMAIPTESGLGIAYGLFYREGTVTPEARIIDPRVMRPEQFQYAQAFGACMSAADRHLNIYAAPNEIAVIVAEDIPEMQKRLRDATMRLRTEPVTLRSARVVEQLPGNVRSTQETVVVDIRRVVDDIHFAPPKSAPILWLADAVAFGLRRYWADLSLGDDFANAISGPDIEPPLKRIGEGCVSGYMHRLERP